MRPFRKEPLGSAESGPQEGKPDLVGDLLPRVFHKLGVAVEIERQEALERWEGVVGERIAAVTRATAVSRGVLFVKVVSSAWLTELNLMRHDIMRRLNAGRGEGRIERIVFTLSEGGVGVSDRGRKSDMGG